MRMSSVLAMVVVLSGAASPALAQQGASETMPGMDMPAGGGSASESSQAYKAAHDRMMSTMNAPLSGNPDQDFVAGMVPHHQGAIDMANVELKYGKDPTLRRLAKGIVAAQNKEIAQMRAWQAKHPLAR